MPINTTATWVKHVMDLPWAQNLRGTEKIELCIFINSILNAAYLCFTDCVHQSQDYNKHCVIIRLNLGFEPQWLQEIFSSQKLSKLALGPAKPPTQWVPGRRWVHTHFMLGHHFICLLQRTDISTCCQKALYFWQIFLQRQACGWSVRFEVLMITRKTTVFWDVTSCRLSWRWRQQAAPKCKFISTTLYSTPSQGTVFFW